MVIIAGWFTVAPEDRDKCVEMDKDLVRRARSAPGCLDIAVSADPLDGGRVNMFECWESEAQFAMWRAQADPPPVFTDILGGDLQKHQISTSDRSSDE